MDKTWKKNNNVRAPVFSWEDIFSERLGGLEGHLNFLGPFDAWFNLESGLEPSKGNDDSESI